jgi:hypothetical protein
MGDDICVCSSSEHAINCPLRGRYPMWSVLIAACPFCGHVHIGPCKPMPPSTGQATQDGDGRDEK